MEHTWLSRIHLQCSLFSLGAGDQIQQYLKKQMEDPFVEGVSVLVPKTDCSSKTLKEVLLDNDTFKSKYAIQNARLFHRAYAIVQGKDGRKRWLLAHMTAQATRCGKCCNQARVVLDTLLPVPTIQPAYEVRRHPLREGPQRAWI